MNVVIANPPGWDLDPAILHSANERARQQGGSLSVSHDMDTALDDAHIVCAKSWGALPYYGNWDEEKALRTSLKNWIVTTDSMQRTANGKFMHCLPVRRNVEVTDDVLDGPASLTIDEAENRMWAQMALLVALLSQ
jgi:N-acetylornithine carbamoyltransferase